MRNAVNAIGNLKESIPLSDFVRRINFRRGIVSEISATARKLGVTIWNIVVKNIPYHNPKEYLYLDEKRKLAVQKRLQKQVENYKFKADDLFFQILDLINYKNISYKSKMRITQRDDFNNRI